MLLFPIHLFLALCWVSLSKGAPLGILKNKSPPLIPLLSVWVREGPSLAIWSQEV